jgi:NADH-quinone oxidoreductase subunit M
MRQLGGLARKMPITAMLWIMGACMLSGFPPMTSFPAEWIMFTGIFKTGVQTMPVGLIVAVLAAAAIILTVAYTFRSVKIIFFGPLNPELAHSKIKDPPLSMSIPLLIIAGVSITLGIYPELVMHLFHNVIGGLSIP